jgi:ectoine hydroxylase-related dioxygenase (phytanoyl-CoA dioxygenase family)
VEPLVETGAESKAQAGELGYLFFRGAVEPELVLAVRDAVLARLELEPVALQAQVLVLPEIDALRRHAFVLSTLGRVFGRAAEPGHGDVCRVVPPAAPELTTRPHQDAAYTRDELWTAWIPLGDCPRRLGGLAVSPGSHRRGLLAHGEGTLGAAVPADARWASADYRCGDVLLFSALTLHRALANESDEVRLSVDFRYAPAG